jgi:hypothetical protein
LAPAHCACGRLPLSTDHDTTIAFCAKAGYPQSFEGQSDVALKLHRTFETGSYGRSVSDEGWEELDPQHIAVWKSAIKLLRTRSFNLPGYAVKIEADWTPILRKHERHHSTMKRLYRTRKNTRDLDSVLKSFPSRKARIKLVAETVGSDKRAQDRAEQIADSVIQCYLHDVFLILNICAPACCDLYRGTLLANLKTEVSLSNVFFEIALLGSLNQRWPTIRTLSLPQTIQWFGSIRSGVQQLPQNPAEKALFALLHISRLDMDPMIVVWIFYALESLFQTRAGENFSSLVQRMISLLDLDGHQSKLLREKMRSLYSIRSGIVHGGFEVSHPMHDGFLDERVEPNYRRVMDATEYGLTVLLAALQSTIARGWKYPTFAENMNGIGIDQP